MIPEDLTQLQIESEKKDGVELKKTENKPTKEGIIKDLKKEDWKKNLDPPEKKDIRTIKTLNRKKLP